MTTLHEHYAARADEARADAQTATLDNVRERCLRAAAAWDVMAARARRTDLMRAKQQADKDAAHRQEAAAAESAAAAAAELNSPCVAPS